MARKIQRAWRSFIAQQNTETQSNLEEIAIVDYKYRTDKLFDYSQIEQDRINKQNIANEHVSFREETRGTSGFKTPPVFLSKEILNQLESFSIEEKLNISRVTFEPD